MKTGLNIEIDPTLTANRTDERKDFLAGNIENGKIEADPGISLRWGITPNMILNAAVNLDFSQVEADVRQLEINRRYAIRYPEKRPFFLEGADFFLTPIEAVFTRTVADPVAGFKFTGKTGKNAIGVFGTRDRLNNLLIPSNQDSESTSLDQNLSGGVFRFRRDVGQGSALGVLYTGRVGDEYSNHVAGVDGFFRLSKTKTLSLQYLYANTDYSLETDTLFTQKQNGFTGGALSLEFSHRSREWNYNFSYEGLSPDFRADFGYIPRVDLRTTQFGLSRNFWGKKASWYDLITVGGYGGVTFDYDKNRTDSDIHAYASYNGPLQTNFFIIGAVKRELFAETKFNLQQAMVQLEMKPVSGLRLFMMTHFGDMIDYSNRRLAWHMILNPAIEFNLGRHLNMNLRHRYMYLSHDGHEIFTANLSQIKLIYNFNVRTFVRAIVQYQNISKNPAMYNFDVKSKNKTIFTQFLFSYKLNPQTVLFIGYSDNHLGYTGIDITQENRTLAELLGSAVDSLDEAKGQITVQHLLTMTSGFQWDEMNNVSEYNNWVLSSDQIEYILNRPLVDIPGQRFNYNTATSHLLSVILTETTGMSTLDFAKQYLFEPIGIENVAWGRFEQGYYNGGASLQLRPRDMIKLGRLYLEQGMYNGSQIIPSEWITNTTQVQITTNNAVPFGSNYGYLWWIGRENNHDLYFANGYGGQFIVNVPDLNLVVLQPVSGDL